MYFQPLKKIFSICVLLNREFFFLKLPKKSQGLFGNKGQELVLPISGCEEAVVEEAAAAEDPLVWCGSTATWLIGDLVLAFIGVAAAAARSVEAVGTRQLAYHWRIQKVNQYIPSIYGLHIRPRPLLNTLLQQEFKIFK